MRGAVLWGTGVEIASRVACSKQMLAGMQVRDTKHRESDGGRYNEGQFIVRGGY